MWNVDPRYLEQLLWIFFFVVKVAGSSVKILHVSAYVAHSAEMRGAVRQDKIR